MAVFFEVSPEEIQLLLLAIAPELRAIRDCRFTSKGQTMIQPADNSIMAADRLLLAIGAPT